MLTDSPVVRATGPRILFLVGAFMTIAILQWANHLRLAGHLDGLTPIFFYLFTYGDFGASVCALLILVLAVFVPAQAPARSLLRWAGDHPLPISAATFIVLCGGALGVYHDHPLSMDEYAAYFQSQVFAAGHLTGQFPVQALDWLIPPGFQSFFLNVSHTTGQVASSYWPAHALLMTPFTLAGIPWACNPLLSALTLLVVHRLALQMFADTEAAGVALLLTLASPVFFGIGISYYSMPAHLLANSLYALLLIRPTLSKAFIAGIVGSIALTLHNPVPHLLFAVPWLVWMATRRGGLPQFAALCVGYLPLCLLLGIGWFELSTHLRADGQQLAAANSGAGTVDQIESMLSVFSLPTATVLLSRLIALAKVWVWAVPGLLILACSGAVRGRANIACRLLTASALTTLIAYLFFPQDQGHGWGYRYFHSAWMALPLLATAAMYRPRTALSAPATAASGDGIFTDQPTRAYVAACIALTLVIGTGYRAWDMQRFMTDDLKQMPHYKGTEHRVVIIDNTDSFYGADLVQNDPWLRGNEIRMFSHGAAEDEQMMQEDFPRLHKVYTDRYGTVWSAAARAGN